MAQPPLQRAGTDTRWRHLRPRKYTKGQQFPCDDGSALMGAKSDYHWVRLLNAIHSGTGMHNIGDRDECKELVRYLYALCNEL